LLDPLEVQRSCGVVLKACWTVHVKSEFGVRARMAPNWLDVNSRKYFCPPAKAPGDRGNDAEVGCDLKVS